MAVTLAEAKKNVQDDLQIGVIDEFRKSNFFWDTLTFDDVVSPTGGGAALTYAYTRLLTQPTAEFREINHEYTPQEVTRQKFTADLAVFGGSFEIDRIIADMGGIVDEVQLQLQQKIKAASALFNDTVINGDVALGTHAFDGLEKALKGSSTEINATGQAIDLSTSDKVTENAIKFLDQLDEFLSALDGRPGALMGNSKLINKIKAVARRTSMYTQTQDAFGRQVSTYDGIPLINLGAKAGTNEDVVSTKAEDGTTSLYAVRFGLDGFHGISMTGQSPVRTWLPDFSTAGAVKRGEVEMVAGVALKATKSAGVLRNIKVK
ncbi:major capsid protein [Veillonella montpellierensis]|uniref:major capsid protein n=1 Tax=Veillonella montpellierensis TaxID=187328 RepID=UPI0023F959E7|nr:phage capsid protein [Veillonella montpellierensis]